MVQPTPKCPNHPSPRATRASTLGVLPPPPSPPRRTTEAPRRQAQPTEPPEQGLLAQPDGPPAKRRPLGAPPEESRQLPPSVQPDNGSTRSGPRSCRQTSTASRPSRPHLDALLHRDLSARTAALDWRRGEGTARPRRGPQVAADTGNCTSRTCDGVSHWRRCTLGRSIAAALNALQDNESWSDNGEIAIHLPTRAGEIMPK